MQRTSLAVIAGILLLCGGWMACGEELAQVEPKILDAWGKHKSLQAKMSLTTRQAMGEDVLSSRGEGPFLVEKRDGRTVFRLDLQNTVGITRSGNTREVKEVFTILTDGQFAFTVVTLEGRRRAKKTEVDSKMTPEPKTLLDDLRKDYELKLAPDETIEGKPVYVIEAKLKQPKPMSAAVVRAYFLQADGAVVKLVQLDTGGQPTQTMTFSELQFDVGFRPEQFVIQLPPDVEIQDLTHPDAPPASTSAPSSAAAKP